MRKKIQMSLATAAILLVAAIFPVQALALEVPQGQTDVRIPVTVSTSGTVAGVEIGFSYTNDGLSFVRFEPSAAVSGAQQISAERYGTTWVGFYSDTNAYGSAAGGQLDMGSLVFDYTGDAANTVSLTNCTVYTVNAANEVVSDDRDWSGEVTVTRASAASSGTGTGTGTGTGSTSTGANSFNISEGDTPLTTTKVTFSDLGGAEWAREAIEYLANNKGILGLGDGLFAPNAEVTRAQFSRFMSQAFGITKGAEPSSFTDVVSGSWYYDDVTLLASNGILKGYEDGRFGPGDPISREQMAAIIDRFIDAKGLDIAETRAFNLTDLNAAAEYARPSITRLYQAEVISGMGDGLYAPKATATRAQSCVIIYNALGKAGLL